VATQSILIDARDPKVLIRARGCLYVPSSRTEERGRIIIYAHPVCLE
jgi:hypothetical protein